MENKLKLNDKTHVLLCGSPSLQKTVVIDHVQVGESQISLSTAVRDLGRVTDANLDMKTQINSVARSCYCHHRSFLDWTIALVLCGAF